MKGIELPINVLIIIAIAVIVLIALVAMFYPAFTNAGSTMTSESAKSAACQILVERNCNIATNTITISNFDANRNGIVGATEAVTNFNPDPPVPATHICDLSTVAANYGDNLRTLCYCYYSITPESSCKALCGC